MLKLFNFPKYKSKVENKKHFYLYETHAIYKDIELLTYLFV